MKQRIILAFTVLISTVSFGQIQSVPGNINGKIYKMSFSRPQHQKLNKRSASNPTYCGQDTVAFTDLASTGYGQISVGNGQATGQFFGPLGMYGAKFTKPIKTLYPQELRLIP